MLWAVEGLSYSFLLGSIVITQQTMENCECDKYNKTIADKIIDNKR